MNQLELDIAKKLNAHLDKQDELQDEVKDYFRTWFEKNLDPVALANDPDGYLDEMVEKSIALFNRKYLGIIVDRSGRFGKSVRVKAG